MQNKISEIQVIPIRPNNGLVGFASFVYDNNVHLSSIGIFTRPEGGFRLTYPTRSAGSNSPNVFYPINRTIAAQIERAVISKFEAMQEMNQ